MFSNLILVSLICGSVVASDIQGCRDRSNFFRQDGGLCFEIPPWQHQPVDLESHISRIQAKWGNFSGLLLSRRQTYHLLGQGNSDITRYMDTVIAPFLDTYHRKIQNSYQLSTTKILGRIKEEVNAAVKKKQTIYKELSALADELDVPPLCDEERRAARTLASSYVAEIHACTEEARSSIVRMGMYAEDMISITRKHMQQSMTKISKNFNLANGSQSLDGMRRGVLSKAQVNECLTSISIAAVSLGYELDLSLTNARRLNEQSCENLSLCTSRARKNMEDSVDDLKDLLHQCVYS